jgi:hypothetical protein
MHNNTDKHDGGHKGMMWMMIPCFLILGFLFLSEGKLSSVSSGGYLWPILIGIFVAAHIWMMFKGHGGQDDAHTEDKIENNDKK